MKSALLDVRGLPKEENKRKLLGITIGLILDGTPIIKRACQAISVVENVPFGSNKNVSQHT